MGKRRAMLGDKAVERSARGFARAVAARDRRGLGAVGHVADHHKMCLNANAGSRAVSSKVALALASPVAVADTEMALRASTIRVFIHFFRVDGSRAALLGEPGSCF